MKTTSILLTAIIVNICVGIAHSATTPEQAHSCTAAREASFADTLRNLTPQQRRTAAEQLAARGITEDYPYALAREEAAETGDIELLRQVIIVTTEEDGHNYHLDVPLIISVYNNRPECTKLLLEIGGNPNHMATPEQDLLAVATEHEHHECMEILLAAGADKTRALSVAIMGQKANILQRLLTAGANPNAAAPGAAPALHTALKNNVSPEIVSLLLKYGADVSAPDADGETPLSYALLANKAEYVKLLLEAGLNVHGKDADGNTPLHLAAYSDKACLEALLAAGADIKAVNNFGECPLCAAASACNAEAVALLLSAGANPDGIVAGVHPIMCAIRRRSDSAECVRLLLDAGADFKAATPTMGYTALLVATANNNPSCVKLLLAAGASPNVIASDGMTPLLYALQLRNSAMVQELISAGADVNPASPTTGATPLHIAAQFSSRECVELLLKAGADASRTDSKGRTPYQVANKNNRELLTPPGANIQN